MTGKKPLKVQQAEGALADSLTILSTDISMVKAGQKPARDVTQSAIEVRNSIEALKSTQKGVNKENVRTWSDEGLEIETEIRKYETNLEQLENE